MDWRDFFQGWFTPNTVESGKDVIVESHGCPLIVLQLKEAPVGAFEVDVTAEFGTDVYTPIRYWVMSGASTETSKDRDAQSGVLASGDVLLIDPCGSRKVKVSLAAGTSGTFGGAQYPTGATLAYYLQKIIDGGLNASIAEPLAVHGSVAHGVADANSPVGIGGRGVSAAPTAVTADQRVRALFDRVGRLFVRGGHQDFTAWTVSHNPGANTKATATKASAGANKLNVLTAFAFKLVGGTTAPAAVNTSMNVIDGASGGTALWSMTVSLQAVAGLDAGIALSGLWLQGTAATAMTVEFAAAGGANTFESVSASGVQVDN